MRTVLVYLLALGALSVGLVLGLPGLFGRGEADTTAKSNRTAAAPPVVAALVEQRQFADTLEALGTAQANESVLLTPNRADHVQAIHFVEGQEVEAGQLLVEMHAEEELALLAEASAVRDERRVSHQRAIELHAKEMVSERELDGTKSLLAAAEARCISISAAIADRQVRAPFAGVLGLRRVSVGAYLQPATIITTLDDLSIVKLDFTIPETWLPTIRAGMTITAQSDAWPSLKFAGTVSTIDTRVDRTTRSVSVRAKLANTERKLRPGMLLKVLVERGEAPVLQVPEEALIPVGQDHFVLRIDSGDIARRIQVQTGRRRPGAVEIKSGLAEGDRVVIEGIVRVRPGKAVRVVKTRESKP